MWGLTARDMSILFDLQLSWLSHGDVVMISLKLVAFPRLGEPSGCGELAAWASPAASVAARNAALMSTPVPVMP
jgi:hypothetical protein